MHVSLELPPSTPLAAARCHLEAVSHEYLLPTCQEMETLQQSRSDQEFRDRELLCARFDCNGSVILAPVVCSEGANQLGIASGEVVRMYHGTSKVAAEQIQAEGFKPSTHGRFGNGVYLTKDIGHAQVHADQHPSGGTVLVVDVDVGRVQNIMNN